MSCKVADGGIAQVLEYRHVAKIIQHVCGNKSHCGSTGMHLHEKLWSKSVGVLTTNYTYSPNDTH